MTSLGSPSPFFLAGKKAYEVERSLRFNSGDSPELTRTPSGAGNRTTWTLSFWAKISDDDLGSHGFLFSTGADSSNKVQINIESSNRITFEAKSGGSTQANIRPSNNLRDVSAWYHFLIHVNTTHASTDNRLIIYINGQDTRSDLANSTYPSQNTEFEWNKAQEHNIGKRTYSSNYFNGYLAEINFIDGSALFADSFTETNSITGQLIPKKYVGSYGTNGFYLNFSDNSGTTATTLGKDSSGNGNNFTPNNFSVAAGAGNDSLEDTPTNNFATINPLAAYLTNFEVPSNGNLDFSLAQHEFAMSSFEIPSSGKWYAEVLFTTAASGRIGISNPNRMNEGTGGTQKFNGIDNLGGTIVVDGSTVQTGNLARGDGDITGISVDRDAGTVSFTVNGSASGTAVNISSMNDSSQLVFRVGRNSSSGSAPTGSINFGQRPFSYLPTGYKALSSANLPDPTILLPNQHFNTVLYSGDGNSTKSITGVGFKPDWLWLKGRNTSYSNLLYDAVRGAGLEKGLNSNETRAEGSDVGDNSTFGYLNSFDSDGFSVTKGSDSTSYTNGGSSTYVAWNWNAGDTDGKTYTVKVVSDSGNKYRFDDFGTSAVILDLAEGGTYIFDQSDSSNAGHPLRFSTTSNGTHGGGSEYTTGVTTVGTPGQAGSYTQIVVAASAPTLYYYCTNHSGMGGQANTNSTLGSSNFDGSTQSTVKVNATAGFSIVKYAGNGSTATIGHGLGVAPQTYIVKEINSSSDWYVYHKEIGATRQLKLNTNDARANNDRWQDTHPTSSVFYLAQKTASNGSGDTYIAYCFSEVAGYSKFGSYKGNGSTDGTFVYTGFRPAWVLVKDSNSSYSWDLHDNKRDPGNVTEESLAPNLGNAKDTYDAKDFLANGFKLRSSSNSLNKSGDTYIYLAFAESPFKNARAR